MTRPLELFLVFALPPSLAALALWIVLTLIDGTDLPVPSTYGLKATAVVFALPFVVGGIIFAWYRVTHKSGNP